MASLRQPGWLFPLLVISFVGLLSLVIGPGPREPKLASTGNWTSRQGVERRTAPEREPVAQRGRQSRVIRKGTFEGSWPLTVDEADIVCERTPGGYAVFVRTDDDRVWPVNGTADTFARQIGHEPDIGPIWLEHPSVSGLRVSIGNLIEYGLDYCRGRQSG